MEFLMPFAGPPLFLVPPGGLTADVLTLTGKEGHHAAAVRRLGRGERADVTDGAGTLAECVVTDVGKDFVTLSVSAVHAVPPPQPRLTVAQALPKGDRGELAVELMTEVGVDTVIPWAAERSVTQWWQPERGAKALARWRSTAREASKQSRRAWLPEITDLATTNDLTKRIATAACAIVLQAGAPAKLHELPLPDADEILLLVGPEGGIGVGERIALHDAGAVEASLGPTVLRTSTAGATAAAILLSRVGRW